MDNPSQSFSMITQLEPLINDGSLFRRQVAPSSVSLTPNPLITGTTEFSDGWIIDWYNRHRNKKAQDVACYYATDVIVAGDGQIWLNDSIVSSAEIMPIYVSNVLELNTGGSSNFHHVRSRPIRVIDYPCLVALGHGIKVYGHFLIELLFRLLIADRAFFQPNRLPYRILLDFEAPKWLLKILEDYFDIKPDDVEFFFPQHERILLRHGYFTTNIFQDYGINPFANELIDDLIERVYKPSTILLPRRIFVTRKRFQNPAAPYRICMNEQNLVDIAVKRHGFTPISFEDLPWHQQIAHFRESEIVLGQAGSGLHNALFCRKGSRLASVGNMNYVQAEIGALRQQHNAFFTNGVDLRGEFSVDELSFEAFLDKVCSFSKANNELISRCLC
jgi:capsular polysaccharide biosynthesis protein